SPCSVSSRVTGSTPVPGGQERPGGKGVAVPRTAVPSTGSLCGLCSDRLGGDGDPADVREEVASAAYTPSTITRLDLDALRRMASSGLYSGESYQRRGGGWVGNSRRTKRLGWPVPPRVSTLPPRPAQRPPCLSPVAGTSLRYSVRPGSSWMSMSTMT